MKYTEDMKFVERFECSIAEFAILEQALKTGKVTPENVINNIPKGNIKIERNIVNKCFEHLTADGHLTKEGNEYRITDDGREDVQKLQQWVVDLPQLVQQPAGRPQQTATPGGKQGTTTYGGPQQGTTYGGQTGGSPPGGQNQPGRNR